jgi:hypothetical protein
VVNDTDLRARLVSDLGLTGDTSRWETPELLQWHQRRVLNKEGLDLAESDTDGIPARLAAVEALVDAIVSPETAASLGYAIVTDTQYEGGADPTGLSDDTLAFEAAWATGKPVWAPPGNYNYNGPGLGIVAGPYISFVGAGSNQVFVTLGASSRLIDVGVESIQSMLIQGVSTIGGIGLFRSLRLTQQVVKQCTIRNFFGLDYTGCYIETNSVDFPSWKVHSGILQGANWDTTMGIAMSGLTDNNHVYDVEFRKNRVDLKLGKGGNNAYITECAFFKWDNTNAVPSISIWAVPRDTDTNAGEGFVSESNKFGAENVIEGDYRFVYADEGAGTSFGDKFPEFTADSVGYIQAHRIKDCQFSGVTGTSIPLIYSTTPNVKGIVMGPINLDGTLPSYLIEYRTPPVATRLGQDNIFGPIYGKNLLTETTTAPPISNASGVGKLSDANNMLGNLPNKPLTLAGAADPGFYVNLLTTELNSFAVTNCTATPIADVHTGADAATLEFVGAGTCRGTLVDSVVDGLPMWVEFDAKAGTLDELRVYLRYTANGVIHWRQSVALRSTEWRRYRFQWEPRESTAVLVIYFDHPLGTSGNFHVGRVRVYHADEPQNIDGVTLIDGLKYRLSVSGTAIVATLI